MQTALLDPRNDVVFKYLFSRSLGLLTHLINAMRPGQPPISVVEVVNPAIEPSEIDGKLYVLDILARDAAGNYFNVEMQMSWKQNWGVRSTLYGAKLLSEQLKRGEKYGQLKPVICIHLLCHDLFKEQDQALWRFELRDKARPHIRLSDDLSISVIELPKADRLIRSGRLAAQPGQEALPLAEFEAWITLFLHWNEETIMSQIDHPPVQQAMERLKELSADENVRRMAEARDLAILMDRLEMEATAQRSWQEGKQEGKQEGITEGLENAVKRLMERGNSEAQARAMLGL